MKITSIVGARPQFIKLAPLTKKITEYNGNNEDKIKHIIVHSGQHYDYGMSQIFFNELGIPEADYNLGIGSGMHGMQTGKILQALEQLLVELKPDLVIIYGDTNSTLAGALAASKLHIPVAHVEAGLRSFNRKMPEEINRVVADHVSTLLLAPTQTAIDHLRDEGRAAHSVNTGDIMYDTILQNREIAEKKSDILDRLKVKPGSYCVATIHRPENTNQPENLVSIFNAMNQIAGGTDKVIFPLHPRTDKMVRDFLPGWEPVPGLMTIDPLSYLDMLKLAGNSKIILTDSGGLQKEAFFLNRPCITLRNETEWVETVNVNANLVVGSDHDRILQAFLNWQSRLSSEILDFTADIHKYFGKGDASQKILDALISFLK